MKNLLVSTEILLLFLFFSCNRAEKNNINNLSTIEDTIATEQILHEDIIERKDVVHFNTISVDTIINDYRIIYQFIDNNKTFNSNDVVYADRSFILTIKKNNAFILNEKVFDKADFKSIIPSATLEEILLYNGRILYTCIENIEISVNATIPETDVLYDVRLTIHNDGQVLISGNEIIMEDDD